METDWKKLYDSVKLHDGEVRCDKCDGKGYNDIDPFDCIKCHGYGKLDWVEAIVGKKSNILFPGNNPSLGSSSRVWSELWIYNQAN